MDTELKRHHRHHEEIARLAHENWEKDGKPLFVAAVTFENWVDAVHALEHIPPFPIPHPPVPVK